MKNTHSAELFIRAQRVTPGGVHSPVRAFRGVGGTPVFFKRAAGSQVIDEDDNQVTDYCLSWGPLILGHAHPEVGEAVRSALTRGWTFGAAERVSLELAELIVSEFDWIDQIRFINSGTEATMTALRLARAATGRSKILKFVGGYHGHVDSLLVKAGSGLADMPSPDSAGVPDAKLTLLCPFDDLQALESIFLQHGQEIAAVILEGVPANHGLLLQRTEFYARVTELSRRAGSLFILDEVITGFRLGFKGAADYFGLTPDLTCYGKIIGGGFPVGAVAGRSELMGLLAPKGPVYQAGTLSANPVAMTAGLATLRHLKRYPPYAGLEKNTKDLTQDLVRIAESSAADIPLRAQTIGSLWWLIFGSTPGVVRSPEQIPAEHPSHFKRVFHALLRTGVYLSPSAFEIHSLSTAHGPTEFGQLKESFKQALSNV